MCRSRNILYFSMLLVIVRSDESVTTSSSDGSTTSASNTISSHTQGNLSSSTSLLTTTHVLPGEIPTSNATSQPANVATQTSAAAVQTTTATLQTSNSVTNSSNDATSVTSDTLTTVTPEPTNETTATLLRNSATTSPNVSVIGTSAKMNSTSIAQQINGSNASNANSTDGIAPNMLNDGSTTPDNAVETTTEEAPTTTEEHICTERPCKNDGECKLNGASYHCDCTEFWTGQNCTQDVDECANSTSSCRAEISLCDNLDGDYRCNCTDGYAHEQNSNKKCEDLDECRTDLHNCSAGSLCYNTEGSFTCECKSSTHYNDNNVCRPYKYGKLEVTADLEWDAEMAFSSSEIYKNTVNLIEENVTDVLNAANNDAINKVKVVSLWKGSVKASAVLQLKMLTQPHVPDGLNGTFTTLTSEDLCAFSDICDSISTDCVGLVDISAQECKCKEEFEPIPGVTDSCKRRDQCRPNDVSRQCADGGKCVLKLGLYICELDPCSLSTHLCNSEGTCEPLSSGDYICRCNEGFYGRKCDIKTVPLADHNNLEKILIGVGVGLGALAFFCALALLIVCCSGRSRSSGSGFSPVKKVSGNYATDDITIDTWEPSLPRPKIKPGAFGQRDDEFDDIEMSEKRGADSEERLQRGGAIDNPAFIPETDYEGNGKVGKLVANSRKGAGDLVYF